MPNLAGGERWDGARAREALERYVRGRQSGASDVEQLRDDVVVAYSAFVRRLASKFANRGEPLEDLIQVGMLGFLKALERFDSERGIDFQTYAAPTVTGEIKRYFRDKAWTIKVPRRLQELSLSISRAIEELHARIGRPPTTADLARHLEASVEEVVSALDVRNAYRSVSLDASPSPDAAANGRTIEDSVGAVDDEFERWEDEDHLGRAMDRLDGRERVILYLKFYERVTQTEIAKRLNVSQMHVSRAQEKALRKIRRVLQE